MRTPNYNFERQERDKAKAAKKAEKAAAKAAAKSGAQADAHDDREVMPDTSSSSAS